ncbi:MAG: hypothetical protein WD426_06900 [Anditalea sp.]
MGDSTEQFYGKEIAEKVKRFTEMEQLIFDSHKDFFEQNEIDPEDARLFRYNESSVSYNVFNPLVEKRMGQELKNAFHSVFQKQE